MTVANINLPAPTPLQARELLVESRFKLWNWGRRTAKSRGAEIAAVCGHGPADARGRASLRGMLHGGDVIWLAPDYPQSSTIWVEDIEPTFRGVPGVRVSLDDRTVTLPNGGRLLVRSAENPNAVRGSGKRLLGVILDEFAHFQHAEYVWRSVVRPALMDNGAWAIMASTPKRGSFFNARCAQVKRGERPGWHYSQADARQNPFIAPAEFLELVSEYPADAEDLREEVFAELIEGAVGLAFPEFDRSVHVVPSQRAMPSGWRYAAGLDWGFAKRNGAYILRAFGSEGRSRAVYEKVFGETHAADIAQQIMSESMHHPRPEFIAADEAMWHDGASVGLTVASEFLRGLQLACGAGAPTLIKAPHQSGSRAARKNLLHRHLAFRREEDGTIHPWNAPKYTIASDCPELARCIELLRRDEKRPDDVDTKMWDHPYDADTYLLASDPPGAVLASIGAPFDQHPGFDANGERQRAKLAPWEQQIMTRFEEGPTWGGSGYQVPRERGAA